MQSFKTLKCCLVLIIKNVRYYIIENDKTSNNKTLKIYVFINLQLAQTVTFQWSVSSLFSRPVFLVYFLVEYFQFIFQSSIKDQLYCHIFLNKIIISKYFKFRRIKCTEFLIHTKCVVFSWVFFSIQKSNTKFLMRKNIKISSYKMFGIFILYRQCRFQWE